MPPSDYGPGPITGFPAPGLRNITRFITTHNKDGEGVFLPEDHGDHHRVMLNGIAVGNIIYSTRENPVDLTDDVDLKLAAEKEPPLHYENGTLVRMVDFAPSCVSPMHRALSIDYGIVIEGEMEIELDTGEKRTMTQGDMSVQRGTWHKWRNLSDTKCARMVFILLDIKPLAVNGELIKEELGDLAPDYVSRE